jgi:tetratricopeptide (TPR) repeat protein
LRILPYKLQPDGTFADTGARAFSSSLTERLREAAKETYPTDNPLLQITGWSPRHDVAHSKTDVFLDRLRYASEVGAQVADALRDGAETALARLRAIEDTCFPQAGPVVAQLHTALMALYIGYREVGGFGDMVRLFDRMPAELQRQAVAREQLALALNRIAEAEAKKGDAAAVAAARQRALAALEMIAETERTAETFGIRGRIHKGWADAEQRSGNAAQADAQLKRAIAVYEEGFRLDPRDYYPGVNAVTLRLRRATPEDLSQVAKLVPVVRFAVDRAPTPRTEAERYWQQATKLELAAAAKDWTGARESLADVLGIEAMDWMRATTANNLDILRQAFAADAEATANLDALIAPLAKG